MKHETSVYAYLEKPSMVDYPTRFAAVFFTSGCNFACGFCHNASLMGKKQSGLTWEQLDAACAIFKREWVNGVVLTGGEPTCSSDVTDLVRYFRDRYGFAVKLDTNGSNPDQLAACLPYVDYVAMDVKCGFSTYPELVCFSDTDKIRRSIELIQAHARDYEFRTTVIDSVHTDAQMDELREAIDGSRRYALQAFIPRAELPDTRYRTVRRTTAARLHELRDRMMGCADEIIVRGA